MAKKEKIVATVLGAGAMCLAGYSWYLYVNPESEGANRQNIEESLAQAYIRALLFENETGTTIPGESETNAFSDFTKEVSLAVLQTFEEKIEIEEEIDETTNWVDSNYYVRDGVTYTPDYAMGELLGVLEVDHAGICRGVYGGSWEAIEHDLDIWMVTAARPDYEIGKTHFAIYGHNHTVQDLSFNRLKDVAPGDVFTYTTDQSVYIYDVTRFFADWRELVTRDYVDNFSIPADKCYIISCGRNEYRYKDIVVEGTLRCVVELTDYVKNSDYYKYEYDPKTDVSTSIELLSSTENVIESSIKETGTLVAEESLIEEENSATKKKETHIEVSCTAEGRLSAECIDENGELVSCEMALFDSDGIIITSWTQPDENMATVELTDGSDYVVGIISLSNSDVEVPEEYVFQYCNGSIERQNLYQEDNLDENGAPKWAKSLFFGMAGSLLLLLVMLVFSKK